MDRHVVGVGSDGDTEGAQVGVRLREYVVSKQAETMKLGNDQHASKHF